MADLTSSERFGQMLRSSEPERPRGAVSEWPSRDWLLGGLAVAALGLLAWYYLGPDLIRYMKMRSM